MTKEELIKELREFKSKYCFDDNRTHCPCVIEFEKILSCHEQDKAVEPLAVLADRADLDLIVMRPEPKHDDMWVIDLQHIEEFERFIGKTYSEAEAKAREYLEGLEDKKI